MPGALPLPISDPGKHACPSSMGTSASLEWGRLVNESEVIRTSFPSFRVHTLSKALLHKALLSALQRHVLLPAACCCSCALYTIPGTMKQSKQATYRLKRKAGHVMKLA